MLYMVPISCRRHRQIGHSPFFSIRLTSSIAVVISLRSLFPATSRRSASIVYWTGASRRMLDGNANAVVHQCPAKNWRLSNHSELRVTGFSLLPVTNGYHKDFSSIFNKRSIFCSRERLNALSTMRRRAPCGHWATAQGIFPQMRKDYLDLLCLNNSHLNM